MDRPKIESKRWVFPCLNWY